MRKIQSPLIGALALVLAPLACQAAGHLNEVAHRPHPVRVETAAPEVALEELARRAIDGDEAAMTELRAHESAGLDALMARAAPDLEKLRTDFKSARRDPKLLRVRKAIDRVSGQRDAHLSGLYWHTDLDRAKEVARQTSRPILSLRMLGRLDEELSCANSRMFRSLLYPHAGVKKMLSERFVLHWSSERPVPKVAIDMGDGRKLTTTITGNSVHYVLDAAGNPIDAIPGLHGAHAFIRLLEDALETAVSCNLAADGAGCIRDAHARALTDLSERYDRARQTHAASGGAGLPVRLDQLSIGDARPALDKRLNARDAGVLALGKGAIELPLLEKMAPITNPTIEPTVSWWDTLSRVDARDFDQGVRAAMALKMNSTDGSGAVKANLAMTVAADSIRNEFVLHRDVHRLFLSKTARTWRILNRKIYAEIFLTPAEDAWLGLRDETVFDALEG